MRAIVVHILAVLLIAIFAVGSPPPAKADCGKCQGCSTEAPAKNDMPCPEKGLTCQVLQSCASQVQKAPAVVSVHDVGASGRSIFRHGSSIVFRSAYLTPETAPPRA